VDLLSGLSNILPEDQVLTGGEELERHGRAFFTYHVSHPPDAVVFPKSRDEVVQVLRFANERSIPVVPLGRGAASRGTPFRGREASAWTRG
jgi:D-lactate dehydrogenase (cytochrome)